MQSRVAQMHAIEHLARLQSYLQPPKFLQRMMAQKHLLENITLTREILKLGEAGLHHHAPENWLEMLEKKSLQLSLLSRQRRPAVLRQTAVGSNDPSLALDMLDAMRWLDRVGYHAWRISNYVSGEGQSEPLFSAQ